MRNLSTNIYMKIFSNKIVSEEPENLQSFQKQSFADVYHDIGDLKNFASFTGEKPVLESLFNKLAAPKDCNLMDKRLQHS